MSTIPLTLAVSLTMAGPLAAQATATLTASRDVADPMPFAIPSLQLAGQVRATSGNRLYVVAVALGDEPIDAEVSQFLLVGEDGATYQPIGAGARPDLIVPVTRIPVGTEVGEILPSDALLSLVRRSQTSTTLEVGPRGTIAFLYDLPKNLSVRALRLADGRQLTITP